jgi:hypothetical protein
MKEMLVGSGFGLAALVAYVMTGRVARRSPHYGGGTVVLSWIGILVPCLGWLAMYQGLSALDQALAEALGDARVRREKDRAAFIRWGLVYVFCAVAASVVARSRG